MEIVLLVLVLLFGILLIRSVRKEAGQRKELEFLRGELREKKEEIVDVSRFGTQLLSLASHQVKSPLVGIRGFAELLAEGAYGPVGEKARETLGKIKKSADGLVHLIETLLDVRKTEEGNMGYEFARADAAKLAEDAVRELRPLAAEKRVELDFLSSAPQAWVNADAQKLSRVIRHLVHNAVAYTPSGAVSVRIEDQGQSALLSVTDTGIGIPADLIGRLFDGFVRGEQARKDTPGGGLGLMIARKIVEAHGGRIWAESAGTGKGSKFFVALKKVS